MEMPEAGIYSYDKFMHFVLDVANPHLFQLVAVGSVGGDRIQFTPR